jgi:hypothetical protein
MIGSDTLRRIRAVLLFLLFPLFGELLFVSAVLDDVYARRRIRVAFALSCLAVVALGFSVSELLLRIQGGALPIRMYALTGLASAVPFLLFVAEVWGQKVSLEGELVVPENRVTLSLSSPREVLTTLNRVLNAAQLRRCRSRNCDNSRLASYAWALLSEYLRSKVPLGKTSNRVVR